MTVQANPVKVLALFCDQQDKDTEALITQQLQVLSNLVHSQQLAIAGAINQYRSELASNPSVEEFFDLFKFLTDDQQRFLWEVPTPYISGDQYNAWRNRKNGPVLPERRHLMMAFLDSCLERCLFSGLGRLTQSLARSSGGDLLPGAHGLPEKTQPSYVSMLECERWQVIDVILPQGVDWYDRCGSVKQMNSGSIFEVVSEIVRDRMLVDLIKPENATVHTTLLSRLQKISGVGSNKGRQIIAWLEASGCEIKKKP